MQVTLLLYMILAPELHEDFCGVEPVTHPPDEIETRPPPIVDEDILRRAYDQTDSAILGSTIFANIKRFCVLDCEFLQVYLPLFSWH